MEFGRAALAADSAALASRDRLSMRSNASCSSISSFASPLLRSDAWRSTLSTCAKLPPLPFVAREAYPLMDDGSGEVGEFGNVLKGLGVVTGAGRREVDEPDPIEGCCLQPLQDDERRRETAQSARCGYRLCAQAERKSPSARPGCNPIPSSGVGSRFAKQKNLDPKNKRWQALGWARRAQAARPTSAGLMTVARKRRPSGRVRLCRRVRKSLALHRACPAALALELRRPPCWLVYAVAPLHRCAAGGSWSSRSEEVSSVGVVTSLRKHFGQLASWSSVQRCWATTMGCSSWHSRVRLLTPAPLFPLLRAVQSCI